MGVYTQMRYIKTFLQKLFNKDSLAGSEVAAYLALSTDAADLEWRMKQLRYRGYAV